MVLAPRNALDAAYPTLVAFKATATAAEPVQHGPAPSLSRPATATLFAFRPREASGAPNRDSLVNHPATALTGQTTCPASTATSKSLTAADRIELLTWHCNSSQGYARMLLETGTSGATPDLSGYALLYPAKASWAVLGIARTSGGVLVWRCATGTALGVFPTMAAALSAVPPAEPAQDHAQPLD